MAANTTREYYDVMMQLAPLLQDGHTNIYPPDELIGKFYARPPIRTMLVEDKVIVTEVGSSVLRPTPAVLPRRTDLCGSTTTSCWPATRPYPCN